MGLNDGRDDRFTSDEIALVVSAGDIEFSNQAMLLDRRYAAFVAAFKEYCARRDQLSAMMPTKKFQGALGEVSLTPEQEAEVLPRAIALETSITSLLGHLSADRKTAMDLASRFGPLFRGYFNDAHFPAFSIDP